MRTLTLKLWLGLAALVLCFSPSVLADSTMNLTSAGSNVFDGIYMGPYYATVNGAANTPIICDDFSDESYIGESWLATVSTAAAPTDTKFSGAAGYAEVAWLANALVNPSDASQADQIQFALWAVFEGSAVQTYLSDTLSASEYASFYSTGTNSVSSWLAAAGPGGASMTPTQLAAFQLYTPDASKPLSMSCSTTPDQICPPQEFIGAVPTPEASTLTMLGIGILMLGILARRKSYVGSITAST